jgi:hypothetical protein
MAEATEPAKPRLTGDAAWKAARDETDRRNSEAKRHASELMTASTSALLAREKRLAAAESSQLKELNARIVARTAGRPAARPDGTGSGGH